MSTALAAPPRPLTGVRVGITSARKIDELTGLLERRGAEVRSAPVLSIGDAEPDDVALRAATEQVLGGGADLFVATTAAGVRGWFEAAAGWGLLEPLLEVLAGSEILARGPKVIGALRSYGLRELWSPDSECLDDVLAHLRLRDLSGRRVVLQEHGLPLDLAAQALRVRGASVTVASVYRCAAADDLGPVFGLVEQIAERAVDAVTFTSAPAVRTLMEVAGVSGREREVVEAFHDGVLAVCVGPVTAAAFAPWGVPAVQPERARLVAMVRSLEEELARRDACTAVTAGGMRLLLRGGQVFVDGTPVRLTGAPYAVLAALAERPGVVVGRKELLARLPHGTGSSEHAVEMAVARLRAAVGVAVVQTVVKRGYRLAVG